MNATTTTTVVKPTVIGTTLNGLLIVRSTQCTYLVDPNWLDIPASITRWKAAGAFTEPAFTPSAFRTGETAR